MDRSTLGESNTKAYLLLQAHLFKLPLPILDYINDTKSVLDQVPRVLNALIDVASDMGELVIVNVLMKLSQLIFQVSLPFTATINGSALLYFIYSFILNHMLL